VILSDIEIDKGKIRDSEEMKVLNWEMYGGF
jgi:hypothetical protein